MKLADLSTDQLRSLIKLLREKESLVARLHEIEWLIHNLEQEVASLAPARNQRRRRPRGNREVAILRVLATAGADGLSMGEIAEKIGRTYASVRVWFSTAGKKIDQIEKIAPGIYRHVSAC